MKLQKIKLSLATAALLATVGASAQTYNLGAGWNLVGSTESGVNASSFNTANTVWKYGTGWSAYSPDTTMAGTLSTAGIAALSTIDAGEGFWVNQNASATVTTTGTAATDTTLSLASGWQLLSLKGDSAMTVASVLNGSEVTTVWKYTTSGWQAYSPQTTLATTLSGAGISLLETINVGEGFWVNASGSADVIDAPPSISAAYALLEKSNAIPLSDAKVYVNGSYVGMTSNSGVFDVSSYADGIKVMISKSGYAPAYGVVKDKQLQVMTQSMSTLKVPFAAVTNGAAAKPIAKVLNSGDGAVQFVVDNMTLNDDVTVAVSTFISPSSAPALNDITDANGTVVTADEMLIIGGAYITVEDSDGNLKFDTDTSFTATVKQSSILSDLDIILNGQNEISSADFEKLAADTKTQLDTAIADGTISLYTIVLKDGIWEYVGSAEIKKYTKMYKEKSYDKYRLETGDGVSLDSLDTFAFVMKMNAFKGELTVNVKEGGYKMFDGTTVTKAQSSDTENLSWVDASVVSATVFGDESITSGITSTDSSGSTTMTYKVPFVNPAATLSLKKEGYYDTSVTCTMSPDGAVCPEVTMYRVPDTATVAGHVYEYESTTGIDDALVTLVNPEVLSADKITTNVDENGTSTVEVGYMPNVEYTWVAMKDDSNVTIKTGTGKDNTILSETEIYTVIVDEYNDGTPPSNFPTNPAGNWTLTVKAEHTFSNSATMIEQAVGSFNLDINIEKLAAKLSGALNEGSVSYYDDLGYVAALPPAYDTSVYGGIQTGFLYAAGGKDEYFAWESYILGDGGNDADGNLKSDDLNDTTTGNPLTCIDDLDAQAIEKCYYDIASNSLIHEKGFFPAAYLIGHISNNFANLLKEDPADLGKNFLASGFTIKTRYKGRVTALDSMINSLSGLKGESDEHNVTVRASSNIDLQTGVSAVKDILDVPSISLVGESATAYLRQVITDTDGSYAINLVPPQLNNSLKIFAKAEGYKFEGDDTLDVQLVGADGSDQLEVGQTATYDLYLKPIDSDVNTTEPKPISTTFNDWNITSTNYSTTSDVNWTILSTPSEVNVTGYIASVYGESSLSLLGDIDANTTGYLWFGSKTTGTFSETSSNYSTGQVSGTITSPSFDLANYAFPTLDFKTWFEVESADIAKGMYDQMEVGFVPSENATLYSINGSAVSVNAGQYYKLDLLNPDYEPAVQSSSAPYTSAGVDAEPKWLNITLPVEQLAGQNVQFRFTFKSQDSLYNGYRGWGIDSVNIKESMSDNMENPPTMPKIDDTNTAYEAMTKVLTKTVR